MMNVIMIKGRNSGALKLRNLNINLYIHAMIWGILLRIAKGEIGGDMKVILFVE